jgi:hypothetical protein
MSEQTKELNITKQCVKCEQSFPLNKENFRINKKTKTGFKNECRACDSLRSQEYYSKHKKKLIKNILKKRSEKTKLKNKEKQEIDFKCILEQI